MRSYFQAILWLLTTLMIIALVYYANGQLWLLALVPLLLFVWSWLLLGEMRNKAIRLELEHDWVTIRGYYGLGKPKQYWLGEISGLRSSVLSSENGSFDYLYLVLDDKRIACISSFHHRNFEEIRGVLQLKLKDLGQTPFDLKEELRDLYR